MMLCQLITLNHDVYINRYQSLNTIIIIIMFDIIINKKFV